MTVSTQGMKVHWGSRSLRASVELLSSMRFSISLLTVICIASVIGTVLKQQEPLGNYVNQFGPFWAQVFSLVSLNTVYSAWWFLLILAFLVTSTSLCIARNAPKILADLNHLKENVREQSLKAFGHRAEGALSEAPEAAARRIGQTLVQSGWKVKLQHRPSSGGWMVAAKKGAANKLGYIAAHSAIVLVCVGGLLDGDMVVRAQMWLGGKSTYTGGGLIADVPAQHRLSDRNPTFRGNLLVAEGTQSGTAILNQPGGVLLQELPFAIELKKFIVEYYSTGMPKLFASDIIIHDRETGEKIPARVEVNHPARHKGIEIYQSSFDDGGSSVTLKAIPLAPTAKAFEIQGTIGGASSLTNGADKLTLEYTGLRVINVENFASASTLGAGSGVDVRKVDLHQAIDTRLGAANKTVTRKDLRNIGPSVSYKLRDAAGQAREFNNYMLPVKMDDGTDSPAVYLLGVRETPADPFQYLRIPVDAEGSMDTFLRLRAALADPVQRELAVKRYASQAIGADRPELAQQLTASASRALALFAGAGPDGAPSGNAKTPAGLQAISDFMEANVPEAERNRAGEVLIRILNGVLFELTQMTRAKNGLKPLAQDDKTQGFMSQMVLSLSDAHHYPAPMAFVLKDFTQVQASVFQVARAPGRNIVYLGCAFLILGVFAMLYVRERRVWVWLAPGGGNSGHSDNSGHSGEGSGLAHSVPESGTSSLATMALSTNRKTMDGDKEFEMLKMKLLQAPL
ncbi:cytochrome c biogenesis protein ResB [Polaromonas sp. JS666]|uniref:cytochrome c biogenesis protein ResB n=1 Tax=Polaromonas sp. (strain JS666 / ATCC BAA-500) TaxID=296591 RepID=UPI00005319E7|nr:cytochrome c biogenesis protein ResB [Polaromonas sp. JS666]ABE42729.1 ResB-like protein [Polaromonas sp. JS666]